MKEKLTDDDISYLDDVFDVQEEFSTKVFAWMVKNFDNFDSIQMVEEAIEEFGIDTLYYADDEFFEELVNILYENE